MKVPFLKFILIHIFIYITIFTIYYVLDRKIAEGVKEGTQFSKIAKSLVGRTDQGVRNRWHNNLDPAIVKGNWTADEGKLLLDSYSNIISYLLTIIYFY